MKSKKIGKKSKINVAGKSELVYTMNKRMKMLELIFIFCVLTVGAAQAPVIESPEQEPVAYIVRGKRNADKIHTAIYKASQKHGVDPHLLASIFAVESQFKINAVRRCRRKKRCYTDYGIGQVHISQIKANNWDRRRMLRDVYYAADKSAEVLAWFQKRYADKEKFWFVRYNCGTKHIYRKTCMRYLHKIQDYYNIKDEDLKEYYFTYFQRG